MSETMVNADQILSQDEVDNLIESSKNSNLDTGEFGMKRVIEAGLASFERLPMLEIVFDRFARILSKTLRNLTNSNIEVKVDNVASLLVGDYISNVPVPSMLAVFKAEEWDNYGLIFIDSSMIHSLIDVLLGGRHGRAAMRIEQRAHTTIECVIVEQLIKAVLLDLSASFEPLCQVTFQFERLELNPRLAMISRLSASAVLARLQVSMDDREGRLEVLMPYATLEPVRELLLQQFMGERFGRDKIWETHLADELWDMDVDIEFLIDELSIPLHEFIELQVGSCIPLSVEAGALVQLRCGSTPLFYGKVGRRKNTVAVKIESAIGQRTPTLTQLD